MKLLAVSRLLTALFVFASVSVFAQELGTATPVSAKRLDQQLERIRLTA